jgi:hypothetical protein
MPGRLIGKASTVNLTTMSRECHISAVLKLPLPECHRAAAPQDIAFFRL